MYRIADLREKFHNDTLTYKGITWHHDHRVDAYMTDGFINGFFGEVDCLHGEDLDSYGAMIYTLEEMDAIANIGPNDDWPVPPERVRLFDDFDSAIDWATDMLNGSEAWQEPLFR